MSELHEIVGACHIHSISSDGTWEIPRIAQTADELGLDFLLFSDHQTLNPKKDGLEGFYGNTLALIGYETSDMTDINHYLCFKLDDVVPGLTPEEYVEEVAERGGVGIIAHPMEKRNEMKEYPPYPWTKWNLNSFHGIEIWNQLSEWMDGLTRWNKIYRFIHPLHSTLAPPNAALKKWDEIALKRKIFGIAGIDAHSFEVPFLKFFKVRIFHYKVMLKSLRNHLLLKEPFNRNDFATAEKMVFDSLLECRLFFSNHRRGDARGFRFWAESDGKIYQMGERIKDDEVVFKAKSPLNARMTLIHNGKPVHQTLGRYLEFRTSQPGVYRLEATRYSHAWIFSNHIYWDNS